MGKVSAADSGVAPPVRSERFMRRVMLLLLVMVAILSLAACSSEDAPAIEIGAVIATETFDTSGAWEEGDYPPDGETPRSVLGVIDGRYVLEHTAGRAASFTWGAGGDALEDVIIEVEAEQLSSDDDNLYGVGCRLTGDTPDDQTGYVFLISGDGHFGIGELRNQIITFDDLLPWRQTGVIHQGAASNTIRAACLGDTLALTVNGENLGSADGSRYRRAGQVGFFAGANEEQSIRVAFDDLTLSEGSVSAVSD